MNKSDPKVLSILRDSYQREKRSVVLYKLLAEKQKDAKSKDIFNRLAAIEEDHARQFAERITEAGGELPPIPPLTAKERLYVKSMSTDAVVRRMESEEERNIVAFQKSASALESAPEIRDLFTKIEKEEQVHSKLLQDLAPSNEPASRLEAMLKGEKWHVSTGSWIGDAIYGVNDGLGAVFGIVSGVAGYSNGGHQVVVAGTFGMIASALSMGSGAFLAAKSEREVHEAQIDREKQEIEESPEHEIEELSLIYQLKGFNEEEAMKMAQTISKKPELFLQTMAQEELGLSEKQFPNPWTALVSSSLATAVGALIPVLPFFFMHGIPAVVASAIISTLAHFAVGAAKSLVTSRNWFASGMEMTIVGVLEAVISYGIGYFWPKGAAI
jgi:VIT1/CCC1 family predicted Fe2+/Mn2+ transporter/rubrerythrin